MRDGVSYILSQYDHIDLIGGDKDVNKFIEAATNNKIDVLLLDIYLDGMKDFKVPDGFEICEMVAKKFPGTKVVVHTMYDDADTVSRMITVGALGFVSKKSGYLELIEAIEKVNMGKRFICSETSKNLKNLNEFLEGAQPTLKPEHQLFSNREKEVLALLAGGFSTRDIAAKLFITEKTVETHRKNMVDKAKVKNTVQLVTYAIKRGLLKL